MHLFADVAELGQRCAVDVLTATTDKVKVPRCWLFMAGFSCKSRSNLNAKASANLHCVQNQDMSTETAFTWEAIHAYIAKALPFLLLLENVPGLASKGPCDSQSDADYIRACLMKLGYYVMQLKFDAECFGSPATRVRLYFLAWLVSAGACLEDGPRLGMSPARFAWLGGFLDSICIGSLSAELFVATNDESLAVYKGMCSDCGPKESGPKRDSGGEWETEHFEAFRKHGLPWPCDLKGPAVAAVLQPARTHFDPGQLTPRQAQLLFFCNAVVPYNSNAIEFVDVNPSMSRLFPIRTGSGSPDARVGSGSSDAHEPHGEGGPWKSLAPTLTGGSLLCVRYTQGNSRVVRPLTGIEVFQLVGWHSTFLHNPVGASSSVLTNLSGNAFSGFATVPLLLMMLSGAGLLYDLDTAPAKSPRLEPLPTSEKITDDSDTDPDL